jgi:hypothetical protein
MVILIVALIVGRSQAAESENISSRVEAISITHFGKLRLLHQSTGNFIEENLHGLEPDVAILAENSNYDWPKAIKILRPKWSSSMAPTTGTYLFRVESRRRFERDVKSVDLNIKVIIPEFLKTITLE